MDTVLWSRPEESRAGTPLLLMLHGYGTDERRMSTHFDAMPRSFTCAAPRAPHDISGDFGWFLLDYFLVNDFAQVVASASKVLAWIDTVQAKYAFSSISLLGYSQGMAMATTLLRLRPGLAAAAVGLSGFVLDNALLAAMEPLEAKVPFYWARDTADLVINPDAAAFTAEWLAANTELTEATYAGMGHNIRADELVDVASFLTVNVPGSFRPSVDQPNG
ncbi:alpha/beta hydrolase [Arthrobacter sp. 35W]|uniref:alpha/beta hydrolase n=1 Tax=Arthrobacter sp. 35W TaxID=1132441 RepID=UPI000551561D|nr:phospholipase [Arthrobacter sp. 35W]